MAFPLDNVSRNIASRNWDGLRKVLRDQQPADIAEVLLGLEKTDRVLLFRALPRPMAAGVFSHLSPEQQEDLIAALTDHETRDLLGRLPPDDRTALLEELPGEVTQRLLKLLSPSDLKEARMLLGYPEDSVGRLMTPDYVSIRPEWSVQQALEHIRKKGPDSETINIVFVTNTRGRLLDEMKLRHLVQADPERPVQDLMDGQFVALSAFQDQEDAVDKMRKYDVIALPVVDSQGIMLGIVTHDDVFDVAEEETTEDFHKVGAVQPLAAGYRDTPKRVLIRARIPWLLILVFVGMMTAGVISRFEDTLAELLLLAAFIPLIIGSGGNTGAQASTIMVRALATGDIDLREWWRTARKELLIGASLGLAMGAATFLLGYVLGSLLVGAIVGISMFVIVLLANFLGMVLPFLLTLFRGDPAVASAPLITTIVDVTGLIVYLGIATLTLRFFG